VGSVLAGVLFKNAMEPVDGVSEGVRTLENGVHLGRRLQWLCSSGAEIQGRWWREPDVEAPPAHAPWPRLFVRVDAESGNDGRVISLSDGLRALRPGLQHFAVTLSSEPALEVALRVRLAQSDGLRRTAAVRRVTIGRARRTSYLAFRYGGDDPDAVEPPEQPLSGLCRMNIEIKSKPPFVICLHAMNHCRT